jgi:ATP-binding cassette, subfamily G (WHITE), member 2, PDR
MCADRPPYSSTRGLDASTALEFTRAVRIATDIARVASIVSIYQASENIYQLFDKVAVIDEGRMSYFGPADKARQYFIDMGYQPANRQTTADFLVGVTHGPSRIPRPGFESRVPRTPAEFAEYFAKSSLGRENSQEVDRQLHDTGFEEKRSSYKASARAERARHMPPGSPYTVSLAMQVRILMRRRVQIIRGDITTQGWLDDLSPLNCGYSSTRQLSSSSTSLPRA